jgi:hypothetical protein
MQLVKREFSLHELPEKPTKDVHLTPRSRQACASEGIETSDLVYRPLEEFTDRQLSPRIVKLRYDYFEAKRKDLLGLAIAARDKVLLSKRSAALPRSHSCSDTIVSSGSSQTNDWGMLAMEKEKLARFQEGERKWLENCLSHELKLLRRLEAEDERLTEESEDKSKKMMEESKRLKELNDRRRDIEEQKQRVAEAQQELDREKAKQAFEKHQEELRKLQEREERKKREAHERSLREAERRAQREADMKIQQDRMWREKQEALSVIEKQDKERMDIIDRCKGTVMQKLHARRAAKEERVLKSIAKNRDLERSRKNELVKKLIEDQTRDERLAVVKQEHTEEAAKKSLQLMLRRKIIQDESQKRLEDRREEMLAQQSELERRLKEHEMKKRRHMEFKLELETLREKNKQLNVERQKKKEMYLRELYAQRVVEKDSKVETIFAERQQLWELRRKTALESQKSRDFVKKSIMEMRIKSKIDSKKLESFVTRAIGKMGMPNNVETLLETDRSTSTLNEETHDIASSPPIGSPECAPQVVLETSFPGSEESEHIQDLTEIPQVALTVPIDQTDEESHSYSPLPVARDSADHSRLDPPISTVAETDELPVNPVQQFQRATGDLHNPL